jgi:alginate O-acetyltransferase complex protein AlgJ
MMCFRIVALLTLCVGAFPVDAGETAKEKAFCEVAALRVAEKPSVQGDEKGWLFLVRELRHLSVGRFWEKPWDEVAANATDPVPSMIEFNALLEERGIQLILAPVPAKARLYPEKLDESFSPGDSGSLTPFIELLRSRGLTVIDLDRHFRIERANGDLTKWYCAQDAHYSPQAIEALAGLVAEEFEIESPKDSSMSLSAEILSLTGDQVVGSEWEGRLPGEELILRAVLNNGDRGIEPDPKSPFLLLGDSHTLVFHQGKEAGMHCRGGGLLDHLSYQFGEAFDLVGVRGSGLVQARKQLYYRAAAEPGFWDRKKLVVWVFSEREFTQSTDRIVSIPLDR